MRQLGKKGLIGVWLLALITMLSACSSADSGASNTETGADTSGAACAVEEMETTTDGFDVVRCHEVFASAPLVRLPSPPAGTLFAALGKKGFSAANGTFYPFTFDSESELAERKRQASAIYRITLDGDTVVAFEPWIIFDERVFLQPFHGLRVEGKISRRLTNDANPTYEFEPSLPLRGEFTLDATGTELALEVANDDHAVTSSEGNCLPALNDAADENSLSGEGVSVLTAQRVPSMHSLADNMLDFHSAAPARFGGGIMGPSWFLRPLDILTNELHTSGSFHGIAGGSPGSVPSIDLEFVSEGGEPCTP